MEKGGKEDPLWLEHRWEAGGESLKASQPVHESHMGQARYLSHWQSSIIKGYKAEWYFKKLPPMPFSPCMLLISFICSLLQTNVLARRDVV